MRWPMILLFLCLAGCSGSPRDYGITGPGRSEPPPTREEAQPGGDISIPTATPNTGNGKFWGYN